MEHCSSFQLTVLGLQSTIFLFWLTLSTLHKQLLCEGASFNLWAPSRWILTLSRSHPVKETHLCHLLLWSHSPLKAFRWGLELRSAAKSRASTVWHSASVPADTLPMCLSVFHPIVLKLMKKSKKNKKFSPSNKRVQTICPKLLACLQLVLLSEFVFLGSSDSFAASCSQISVITLASTLFL